MGEYVGTVVTDGRVLLGSDFESPDALTVIPREIRVNGETLRSDERINRVRALVHEALERGRSPEVLPPQREQFLGIYQQLAERQPHVVSIHYLGSLDGAAREARVCRQLMQPLQQIDVYEAKALEGGLEFVIKTAQALAQEGASATQLLALLRYLEPHMLTFLLTPGAIKPQPWNVIPGSARLRSLMPSTETLWHVDPKQRKLVVVEQGDQLTKRIGAILQHGWGKLRYEAVVRYRGYSQEQLSQLSAGLEAAGLPEPPRLEPVAAAFLPCLPSRFIELLLLPTAADVARLRGLVQDPIWWKGAA
ncbi:MAG TPA: DegV family protein [Herpetosiphonaceae bacterium]